MEFIKVRGAKQHNLKNINCDIPKNKLVVFTGLSGSGKSSLAFDTIYAEGQRRYVESLSSYARQFLGIMDKPDVDTIEGLSPAISIDQKSTSHNPRSTVGTVTEIYDYLRLLYARIGHPHCPNCGREIARQSLDQIVATAIIFINEELSGSAPLRFHVLSPVVRDRKGEFTALFDNLKAKGYQQVRIDKRMFNLTDDIVLIKTNKHTIDVVTDKISVTKKDMKDEVSRANVKSRLSQSIEQALRLSEGLIMLSVVRDASFSFPVEPKDFTDHLFSERFACPVCSISLPEIEPRSLSFNSPHGACPTCNGIGTILKIDPGRIFNPNLTISEGGILPYAKLFFHDTWFTRTFKTVLEENQINMRLPIKILPAAKIKILLFGTDDRTYKVEGQNRFGRMTHIYEQFQGIIADLQRRYFESESEFVRFEIEKFMRKEACEVCKGGRLKKDALGITIREKSIVGVTDMPISSARVWIQDLPHGLSERELAIATSIVKEIDTRLGFLENVGLEYLTLGRSATSLSGGEAQRIRLASQIGSGLTGVLYVLDEPSIGLHQRDNRKLIRTLKHLRDLGNTVIVVEHDREIIEEADMIYDFGPQAGDHGGQIIFSGSPGELKADVHSLTGKYLKDPHRIRITHQSTLDTNEIRLTGASHNNLKQVDLSLPLGKLICVTGVSGSGKSSLVVETLYHGLARELYPDHGEMPGKYKSLKGVEWINKVILVDQSPIGRTPRSNPATYTGVFSYIRDIFALSPTSRAKGFKSGRFSFNVKGGRCEACQGEGQIKIEMQFLSDVYVTCEVCHGARYNSETLEVRYKGKNIAEILNMTIEDALNFFGSIPSIYEKLKTLKDVGLTYIRLGQPAPTLSGGEAQRVKLATELSKRQTGKTVYILDEPTTGLHFSDLEKLMNVLIKLTDKGNTVVVIEHNLDVIKNADYIIDLGLDGGERGGKIVAIGTPAEIAKSKLSYTGKYLKLLLAKRNSSLKR